MTRMPFGKHKGEPLSDIPSDYLEWCLDNCTGWQMTSSLRRAMELEERREAYYAKYAPSSTTTTGQVVSIEDLLDALKGWRALVVNDAEEEKRRHGR